MELTDLGLSEAIRENIDSQMLKDHQLARVTAVDKESYVISGEAGECRAELTGRLQYTAGSPLDFPTVGDWVYVQYLDEGTFAVIHALVPRKSLLRRKAAGRAVEVQLIAANVDTALIMQSLDENFNLQRMERYMVMATEGGVEPVILLSKSDLVSAEELGARLAEVDRRHPGLRAHAFSNLDEAGVSVLRGILKPGETFCLLGSSGVGKTTLLNNLLGEEVFSTRPVMDKKHKGRHTTTRRQLTVIEGGAILVDTPGMRELGALDVEAGLESTFAEIAGLARQCRFPDCSHTSEPGCAVLEALKGGGIEQRQYENFMKMARESAHYSMTYHEKRRKDKNFGKMVRSVKKTLDT